MVSKITIFEPHIEGAQIGPASLRPSEDGPAMADAPEENEDMSQEKTSQGSRRRSLGRVVLAAGMLMAAGVAVAALRQFRMKTSGGVEIESQSEQADLIEAEN